MKTCTLQIKDRAITVRPVQAEDAAAWLRYLCKVGGETDFLAFTSADVAMTADQACRYLAYVSAKPNDLFLVAIDQSDILATLHFRGVRWPCSRHRGEFGLSVLKDFWGNGLARFLMQYMFDWARDQGITKINLKVRTDNLRAINLYHRLGFVIEGTVTREYMRPGIFYSAYQMGLKL